jgi:hypothetical protein
MFDNLMGTDLGLTFRGSARAPAPPPVGKIEVTKSFMTSAGATYIFLTAGIKTMPIIFENQADYFYFSGHGHHDANTLEITTGTTFTPSDVARGQWKKDLEIVILAGCSVLDVTGDKVPFPYNASAKPGKAWAKTGPTYFLGYEWKAPLDRQGTADIVQRWEQEWEVDGFGNPIRAWMAANEAFGFRNACAIDCSVSPKVAWHFVRRNRTWILEMVPEDRW